MLVIPLKPKENLTIIATFADGEVVSFDIKTLFEKYPVFNGLNKRRTV